MVSQARGVGAAACDRPPARIATIRFSSTLWLLAAAVVLWLTAAMSPPGGVSWRAFAAEPMPLLLKLRYLAGLYIVPAVLSFAGIVLFQLQFRMSMSGAKAPTVFAMGVLGSTALLGGFRLLALAPNALPGYVVGMALGYTVMARLYALRMRTLWGKVRVPSIVWRGDGKGMREIDRQIAAERSINVPTS